MAAVELLLFNDIANRKLVNSLKDASEFTLPAFFHQDKISILISFLKILRLGGRFGPYELVDISGASFEIKIYNAAGDTLLASQTVWTKDTGANTLAAALDLNTAAMATALGAATQIQCIIEFQLGDSAGTITTYQRTVTVKREYNTAGSPVTIPDVTYPTDDQANARFVKFVNNAGESITLKSANGNYQAILYVTNDGDFRADVIGP